MQETAQITTALRYLPWGKHVALVTDGRFSGFSSGACIGHVGPEALDGGPIGTRARRRPHRDRDRPEHADAARVNLVGAEGVPLDAGSVRRAAPQPAARIRRSRRTSGCPTTPASGRRCSARAAAPGRAASTTSTGSCAALDDAAAARREREESS